ncbi:hypothetical protein IMZ48_08805 [Candidatus Bathyarchaeota archaeon]|nr:hypothetical protein [Candidatus Bathyarchaeota archaeon]
MSVEKKYAEITRKEWATIDWVEVTRIPDTDRTYIAGLPIHDPARIVERYAQWEAARQILEGV